MPRQLIPRALEKFREARARPVKLTPPRSGEASALGAVLTRGPDDIERDLGRSPDAARRLDQHDVRVFAASGHDASFPPDGKRPAALFGPWPRGLFDRVWVTRTNTLFDTPWGRTFVARAAAMLAPGGELLVPFGPAKGGRGLMPRPALERLLGRPAAVHRGDVAVFTAGHAAIDGTPAPATSILGWYLDHAAELVLSDLRVRTHGPAAAHELSDPIVGEFMLPGSTRSEIGGGDRVSSAPDDLAAAMDLAVRRQSYQVGGIAHKAALLRYILDRHLGGRDGLAIADLGGGYGLLAAELLLDSDSGVQSATCVDPSPYNVLLATELYRGLRTHLHGRFRFVPGPGEQFEPDGPLDAVSFVGSLLYLPREHTKAALQRAWDALRPGGILVVHENIKDPRFTADYDRMFTVDEIDGLLEGFGTVDRYHTTTAEACSRREAADRAVYRVVTRTGNGPA